MTANLLVDMVHGSGLHRLFAPFYGGHTSVLLLHRVLPGPQRGLPSDNLKVTPEFLDAFVSGRQKEGWRFISLDHLVQDFDDCVAHGRNMVLTLDDGYRDNFDHAWPIFSSHGVPFTVYVANSFPAGTADFWWYTLEEMLLVHRRIELEYREQRTTLDLVDPRSAFIAFKAVYQPLPAQDQAELMAGLRERYPLPVAQERLAMTWDEVRALAADELCSIGCHTLSHRSLAPLPRDEAFRELVDSRVELERETGCPVRHLAYPYGKAVDAGRREEELARDAGFQSAVTTRIGNLHAGHREHPLMLPRIPLYEGGKNGKLSEIFLSGMYSAVTNGFRKVVTY
ncbi:polysaccharide deacetylase family protein [Geomonas subterranea]|uniref:Polysaccharide deacetylase family protein n=1 Tax=Geomonas subterranea TaxID=2847989 RepID=A0ABX8LEX2_9BACT|nr:polysaccharide deacetylase family protein [Geomonas subterranea]QXE90603.1 polysaccharide deacetylase family protein [Geomonas subterranea]QXM11317.1 polysaccharide deacetylase family protein [Geomonas subterranea]